MSLDAILEDDKTPVTGDNTELVISAEDYTQPLVTPAQLELLKRVDVFKESRRVFDGLASVDKTFAVEAMAAFITQDPRIGAKLTASPSVANRRQLNNRFIEEAEVLEEQMKVLMCDLQIATHQLSDRLKMQQPNLDVYHEKLKTLAGQFVDGPYTSNPALVVYRGSNYELYTATPLRTIAYRIDDTAILYPPFEGKLSSMAAEVINQLEQHQVALSAFESTFIESGSLQHLLGILTSQLSVAGEDLQTPTYNWATQSSADLHGFIARLSAGRQALYLVTEGAPLMDAAIRFSELLLYRT